MHMHLQTAASLHPKPPLPPFSLPSLLTLTLAPYSHYTHTDDRFREPLEAGTTTCTVVGCASMQRAARVRAQRAESEAQACECELAAATLMELARAALQFAEAVEEVEQRCGATVEPRRPPLTFIKRRHPAKVSL